MHFLIDAQLPPRLAKMLRSAGHEAEHLFELGVPRLPDQDVWRIASERGAAIVTKDADFAAMRMRFADGPMVIWVRMGNIANGALLALFERALPEIVAAADAGEVLVELR